MSTSREDDMVDWLSTLEKEVKRLTAYNETQHQTNINLTNEILEIKKRLTALEEKSHPREHEHYLHWKRIEALEKVVKEDR